MMGLFKKLKKGFKKIAKIAVKTAPIWTSFVPGGGIVGKVIEKAAPFVDKVQGMRAKLKRAAHMVGPGRKDALSEMGGDHLARILGSPTLRHKAELTDQFSAMRGMPPGWHSGIVGPTGGWGPHRIRRAPAHARRAPARRRSPYRRRTVARRGYGAMRRRRYPRRRAA